MEKFLIILFSPPMQSQDADTVLELAKAAVETGQKVTIFCDIDAVYNLLAKQISLNQSTPASKFAQLIKEGVQILACRESARLRGLDVKNEFLKGVVESSLGRLAELIEQADRVVAFGP